MTDIDWGLLSNYFLPDEEVDFEYELYGRQTFRRDADDAAPDEVQHTAIHRVDRLLDELSSISEDRRFDGVEGKIPTTNGPTRTTTEEDQAQTMPQHTSRDTATTMHCMQIRRRHRRRETRSVCVHNVWPDPATGCVYGGHCALFLRQDKERTACVHSSIQPSHTLHKHNPVSHGRQCPIIDRTGARKFASYYAWQKQGHRKHEGCSEGNKIIKEDRPTSMVYSTGTRRNRVLLGRQRGKADGKNVPHRRTCMGKKKTSRIPRKKKFLLL